FLKIDKAEIAARGEANPGGARTVRVTVLSTPRTYRIWASYPSVAGFPLEGISEPLGYQIYKLTSYVLAIGAWVAVLAGVVITSFFIPNMLRKGTVDLLLVKPIDRWLLLVYKYIGGLSFIFLSTSYAVGGIWLVLGIRSGLWANGALVMILTITFFFAILYAVSTLVGVVTNSTVTSIMVTIGAWFVFFLIGQFYAGISFVDRLEKKMAEAGHAKPADERWGDGYLANTVRALHFVTPRTGDLNTLNDMLVYTDFMTGDLRDIPKLYSSDVNWLESLIVSALWICLCLGLASLWFTYKDY
ncbi:MAG: ABC transporter permease subunit, partial [Planctomycetes bacterium]|nr:ABC transporter permease subunit [Planctomycetota bacterium]